MEEVKFIEKLDIKFDVNKLNEDLNNLLKIHDWPERTVINNKIYPANQLGLTYRKNAENIWLDAGGNLYDYDKKEFIATEKDFSEINSHVGEYTQNMLSKLSEFTGESFGRVRYMRLHMKNGLTVHKDFEPRYHIVLQTNDHAMFGEAVAEDNLVAKCYHLPADGYVYKVDTTREHFVYNGGWEDRIHLVLCKV
jgi:hypothetical protein